MKTYYVRITDKTIKEINRLINLIDNTSINIKEEDPEILDLHQEALYMLRTKIYDKLKEIE